jgi:hypothetical protein
MDIASSPQIPEPEALQVLVVYDVKTGAIVHRHHVVTLPGAPRRSKEELEARALELVRSLTGTNKDLAVLHADPQAFLEPVEYRVDPKKQEFVRRQLTKAMPARKKKTTRKKSATESSE